MQALPLRALRQTVSNPNCTITKVLGDQIPGDRLSSSILNANFMDEIDGPTRSLKIVPLKNLFDSVR